AMADFKSYLTDVDDFYDLDFSKVTTPNRRIGVRYVREDIAASVCKISIYFFGIGFKKDITVELVDISSKGVLISTNQKLKVGKKITITLKFEDDKAFTIKAKIVREILSPLHNQYGIKFDRLNNDLGDYLLETQNKLVFR
ncbi:MAG: PilZ domain-containing protein, partial [Methylococcales bacterium]